MPTDKVPINRRFRTLDEYLAHLQRTHGPIDRPWYRQVKPGLYELQSGNLRLPDGSPKPIFTRKELEKKFGFAN